VGNDSELAVLTESLSSLGVTVQSWTVVLEGKEKAKDPDG
jgi:hypothetical protein